MTRPVWATSLGSEFDAFLYAPIREEGSGMLLSVISALARLDLDPWQEAAKLAGLPAEAATQRLTSMIAALPKTLSVQRAPVTSAARLIALLPHQNSTNNASRAAVPGANAVLNNRTVRYAIFFIFMLGVQWIVASHHPTVLGDKSPTTTSSTVSPPISPQNTDQ